VHQGGLVVILATQDAWLTESVTARQEEGEPLGRQGSARALQLLEHLDHLPLNEAITTMHVRPLHDDRCNLTWSNGPRSQCCFR
jgi:hypothetical protein